MPTIKLQLTVVANNGADDNKQIDPAGGDIFFELNRGFNCVISSYRLAICTRDAAGQLTIKQNIAQGSYPSPADPSGPAPLFRLGAPAELISCCVVLVTDGVAVPPGSSGQIDVLIRLYQKLAAASRRIDKAADSITAVQLQSRFEIDITDTKRILP